MVFKRVDRYVSTGFLVRFAGAVFVMAFLYVSFDILKRIENLQGQAAGEILTTLGAYYARVVPLFIFELVPGLVLIAGGMVVVKMAASRELLALKASGTSIYRVIAPIFFWTLLVSAAVFLARERLGPGSVEQGAVIQHVLDDPLEHHLLVGDDEFSRNIWIAQYDFAGSSMLGVWIMEDSREDGHIRRTLQAERGHWGEPGELVLLNVLVQEFPNPGAGPPGRAQTFGRLVVPTSLSPVDMVDAADEDSDSPTSFQALSELRRYCRLYPDVPHFRVSFHSRLASFFSPLILLLVGIPCLVGFERSVNSRFLGIIIGIAIAGGLYSLTFIFTSMGTTGSLAPVAACWLPQIAGGALGLWLFEAMLT
jgi:lipopolysaccharide export LptBFGC system permease protein LptF